MLLKAFLLIACVALAQGARRRQRIFGGTKAALGEFPWQVSLQYSECSIPFCGGIILDEFHVLTAAHCMYGLGTRSINLVSRTLDISNGTGNGTVSTVLSVINHNEYDPSTQNNNLAIIKLSGSKGIELDGVRAAAVRLLPQDTPVVAGTPTQVSGWGLMEAGGFTSGPLMKADLPIIDTDECKRLYWNDLLLNEICAGTADNLMDACSGDDGTALVLDGTLVGVATWGNTCGLPNQPGRYTNAARYTNWIVENSNVAPPAQ